MAPLPAITDHHVAGVWSDQLHARIPGSAAAADAAEARGSWTRPSGPVPRPTAGGRTVNGMQIQVHTDRNVDVSDGMVQRIEAELESALSRFSDQITRVEVHLGDESAGRSGGTDKRCMLEARPAGQQPVVVTHHAASVGEACSGAVRKLETLLEGKSGRANNHKGGESIRHLQVHEGLS
jgi:ribosome-associated translation inhibitor RaiA